MSKRAVLYARVSGDDRDKDGRNLKGQVAMGREYAAQHGYTVVAEMPEDDGGASGAEIDLPMLTALRGMAQRGEFDVLIVREIDRLSRNLAKQLIVEAELKKAGVLIEYVIGEYPDTPEGNFMKHVRASVAEFEREKIKERMARGRELKVKGGSVLVNSRPPYGYRVKTDGRRHRLEVYEPEAVAVRLIYEWYTGAEPMAIQAIAKRLTEMGVPTSADEMPQYGSVKLLPRGHWGTATIGNILASETYAGVWHWGKLPAGPNGGRMKADPAATIPVPGAAIIDRPTWEAAQARRAQNKHLRAKPKYPYLMAGRLTCACGYALCGTGIKTDGKQYLHYRCAGTASREVARRCTEGRYRAERIDAMIWEEVRGILSDPDKLREAISGARAEAERATAPLRGELETIIELWGKSKAASTRLLEAVEAGVYKMGEVAERKARLDAEQKSLAKRRAKVEGRIAEVVISDEAVGRIMAFAEGQAEKVALAASDFDVRRGLMADLDVRGVVRRVDGEVKVSMSCILGKHELGERVNQVYLFAQSASRFCYNTTLTLADLLFRRAGVPVARIA